MKLKTREIHLKLRKQIDPFFSSNLTLRVVSLKIWKFSARLVKRKKRNAKSYWNHDYQEENVIQRLELKFHTRVDARRWSRCGVSRGLECRTGELSIYYPATSGVVCAAFVLCPLARKKKEKKTERRKKTRRQRKIASRDLIALSHLLGKILLGGEAASWIQSETENHLSNARRRISRRININSQRLFSIGMPRSVWNVCFNLRKVSFLKSNGQEISPHSERLAGEIEGWMKFCTFLAARKIN